MHLLSKSAVQQQADGVLDDVLDTLEEGDGFTAINEAVIIGQGHIHDRPRQDLLVDHHGPLVDAVHAQDGRLRGVDDGCGQQAAIHPSIGDGEGAASHVVDANCPIPGLLPQRIYALKQHAAFAI